MKKMLLLFALVTSGLFAQDIFYLLPDSVDNWIKSDSAELYVGEGLYTLIDGGADIFNEYGFDKVLTQRYSNPDKNNIDVEIYEMKDSYAAYGIFSLFTFNTGKRIKDMNEAYAGDQFLLFRKGNFYISLTGSISSEEINSGMLDLAKEIDSRIYGSGKPALVSMFNQMLSKNNPESRIAYFKGNLGIYNLSTISFGNNFKAEEGICLETNSVKSFVFSYGNKDSGNNNYIELTEHLKKNKKYRLINSGNNLSLFSEKKNLIKCEVIGNNLIVSISENKPMLIKISEQIKLILTKN